MEGYETIVVFMTSLYNQSSGNLFIMVEIMFMIYGIIYGSKKKHCNNLIQYSTFFSMVSNQRISIYSSNTSNRRKCVSFRV